jgi:hypothetical protein
MTLTLDHTVLKRNAVAYWKQNAMNRPVKITAENRAPAFWSEGYITCRKFVTGRTLDEVERILGLRPGELEKGAYVHEFIRLPTIDEFEVRGYTQTPAGQAWTPASAYPAGAGAAQWEIRKNTFIPIRVLAFVAPGHHVP